MSTHINLEKVNEANIKFADKINRYWARRNVAANARVEWRRCRKTRMNYPMIVSDLTGRER